MRLKHRMNFYMQHGRKTKMRWRKESREKILLVGINYDKETKEYTCRIEWAGSL